MAKASEDLAAAEAELAERNAELKVVQDELAGLQEELRVTMEKKDKLESDVKICADRLKPCRAVDLRTWWRERSWVSSWKNSKFSIIT